MPETVLRLGNKTEKLPPTLENFDQVNCIYHNYHAKGELQSIIVAIVDAPDGSGRISYKEVDLDPSRMSPMDSIAPISGAALRAIATLIETITGTKFDVFVHSHGPEDPAYLPARHLHFRNELAEHVASWCAQHPYPRPQKTNALS